MVVAAVRAAGLRATDLRRKSRRLRAHEPRFAGTHTGVPTRRDAPAMRTLRSVLVLAAALAASGCYGYRGGWRSEAFVGTPPAAPARTAGPAHVFDAPLALPGVTIGVEIDNDLRTYDGQYYFGFVPLGWQPRDVYLRNHDPRRTQVRLLVTPGETAWTFDPSRARLSFAGRSHAAVAGSELVQWDAQGREVGTPGRREQRAVAAPVALAARGKPHYLWLTFDTPTPAPTLTDIELDLSQALSSPAHPPLPPIRFVPRRWRVGYT